MKRNYIIVGILTGALIATTGTAVHNSNEAAMQSKINSELQMEVDKLQEIDDLNFLLIQEQQLRLDQQQETIDRLMTLDTAEAVQRTVMTETRGGSLNSAAAVTQTVLDRSSAWGMSAAEVINAPGQYAGEYTEQLSDEAVTAFELVYLDGYRAFTEPTTHFYASAQCHPAWADSKETRGCIGGHVFMF